MRYVFGEQMQALRADVRAFLEDAGTLRRLSPEEIAAVAPEITPTARRALVPQPYHPESMPCRRRRFARHQEV
jgi:hypothetical protein